MKLAQTTQRLAMATLICGLLTGMATAGFQVRVMSPIQNRWMNDNSYRNVTDARKRAAVLSNEYWVVYTQNGRKKFENGGTKRRALHRRRALRIQLRLKSFPKLIRKTAIVSGGSVTPPRTTTYVVSRYHPITRRHIHTQRFTDKSAALNWYNHNRKIWWVFVYSGFERKPSKEYRGSRAVCERTANNINRDLFNGQRAKAYPPNIRMRTQN